MRVLTAALAASGLLLGAVKAAPAQTPADSGRHEERIRSRGWMYMPRYQYRIPRMRLDLDHLRMDALDRAERVRERAFALQDRLRDRQFELRDRLRDRQFEHFDREDRAWRRQMELHERLMDRMHERMDRLDRVRPFVFRRRYGSI